MQTKAKAVYKGKICVCVGRSCLNGIFKSGLEPGRKIQQTKGI